MTILSWILIISPFVAAVILYLRFFGNDKENNTGCLIGLVISVLPFCFFVYGFIEILVMTDSGWKKGELLYSAPLVLEGDSCSDLSDSVYVRQTDNGFRFTIAGDTLPIQKEGHGTLYYIADEGQTSVNCYQVEVKPWALIFYNEYALPHEYYELFVPENNARVSTLGWDIYNLPPY